MALEHWRWKLKGQPSSVENVWVAVASDDGRIVGHLAGIPARFKLAGQIHSVMISVDTMTAPDFQRRGILTKLGAAAYASWREAGISAVLGLLNQRWGSRGDALGWVALNPLAWRRAPLHVERALARKSPAPLRSGVSALGRVAAAGLHARHRMFRRGLQIAPVALPTAALDQLWERIAPSYDNAMVRDARWVGWRYLQAPDLHYTILMASEAGEPAGYVAYRLLEAEGRSIGIVADLFAAPSATSVARSLLGAAFDDLWARGAETARVVAIPTSPVDRLLRAGGFSPTTGEFDFRIVPLDSALDANTLRDPATWLLAAGDFDAA
jgi:GNAT superfamily N-acetyltransferase